MIRIEKKEDSKYAYALGQFDTWRIKIIGLAGLLSLTFMVVGFMSFMTLSVLTSIILAPSLIMVTFYHFIQYVLMAKYPGFDVVEHIRRVGRFKRHGKPYRVAVLIPAAGEDVDIVRETVSAALKIDYPHYQVFLLDDSKEGIYCALSKELGSRYVRRPNTGEHKKAGNLNYTITKLQRADYVLVLDADFVPRPEILNELLAYADDDVGIVQSPQHFPTTQEVYKRSKIEYGAAYIQKDFYRITQVARNRYGSAICVGTNALYNCAALEKVGGYEGVGRKDWGHSEDVNTGLKIINSRNDDGQRYKIIYVPVQLAIGTCPDKHSSFYKQQNRWCTGSMQLMFSKKTLFSKQLSLAQKICYASNSLYYFYTIGLLLTPIYLLVILMIGDIDDWRRTILFVPMLITNYFIGPFILRKPFKPFTVSLVVLSNAYTFVHALYLLLRKRPLGWEATGSQTGSRSRHFTHYKMIASGLFIMLYIVTIGVICINESYTFSASIVMVSIFISSFMAHVVFLFYALLNDLNRKTLFSNRRSYAAILLALVIIITIGGGLTIGRSYDLKLSDSLSVRIQREFPIASK